MVRAGIRIATVMLYLACQSALGQVLAEKRVALVIGNSNYAHVADLPNPRNDASDIQISLTRLGFHVTKLADLGYDQMRRSLRDFGKKAAQADTALVFYAGHGLELNNQNFLIPTDAKLKSDEDVEYEAIPLELVSRAVGGARQLRLVLLDACRNNPFLASMEQSNPSRSIGRGLARYEPSAGTLVSYAAKEGTTADDGRGRNSPYTTALLRHLEQPGLEVNFLFRKVRDSVLRDTGGRQEPFTYGSLPGKQLYLVEPLPDGKPKDQDELQRLAWAMVENTENVSALRRFIADNPDSKFLAMAKERLGIITSQRAALRARERENAAWGIVQDANSIALVRNFLAQYPQGLHAEAARKKIELLERTAVEEDAATAAAEERKQERAQKTRLNAESVRAAKQQQELAMWKKLQSSYDLLELQAFINRFPDGPFTDLAKARLEAAKRRQIAALQSDISPAQEKADTEKKIALQMQRNLFRLGCYDGALDGAWGSKSRKALQTFARRSKVELASLDPSPATLDLLQNHKTRACGDQLNVKLPGEKDAGASRFDGLWRLTKTSSRCRIKGDLNITIRGGKVLMAGGKLNKDGSFKFKGKGNWFRGKLNGNRGSGYFGGRCPARLVRVSE